VPFHGLSFKIMSSEKRNSDSGRASSGDGGIAGVLGEDLGAVTDAAKTAAAGAVGAAVAAPGAAIGAAIRAPGALADLASFALDEGANSGKGLNVVEGAMNTFGGSIDPSGSEVIDPSDITITAKKAQMLMTKSALAAATTLVERETLKTVIEENHRRFTGCLMLPVTLLFFVFYAGAASMHEDITQTHLMESPIRDKFIVPAGDGNTPDILPGIVKVEDVWQFMLNTYVPTFFSDKTEIGIPLPLSKRGRSFMYNQMVGAAEISTQRSPAAKCTEEDVDHMMCYDQKETSRVPFGRSWANMPLPAGTAISGNASPLADQVLSLYLAKGIVKCSNEGFEIFAPAKVGACPGTGTLVMGGNASTISGGRRLEDDPDPGNTLRDELQSKMPQGSKKEEDEFKFYLYQGETLDFTKERVTYLKDRGFIDHQTLLVSVKTLYLNNELDIPRMDVVSIVFYVSRGGGVYVKLRMEAIFLKTFSRGMTYFWDFLFFTMLVASTSYISIELCIACKRRAVKSHFSAVNCITWLTVFMGWFNALGLLMLNGYRSDARKALEATWVRNDATAAAALIDKSNQFTYFASWYRVFVADAHIIFMMRCFIALQWQPRLSVVTATLVDTSVDLFHFLIVFVPTFIAFAIAGNEMFGRRISQFSTIEGAICVCFKIAMESEFDWKAFSEEDFVTAMTWVWLYVLLVVLLMLNMVLAIIMDVYSVIRLKAGNSETVWDNIIFLCYRSWMNRKWVKDSILLERVANMPRTVAQDEILKAIPELTDYQLNRLMNACAGKAQAVMRMGVHDSYTAQMTAATKIGLDGISRDISKLKERGWMGRGIEAGTLPERMLAQDILQSAALQAHWMELMKTQIDNLKKKTQGRLSHVNLCVTFFKAQGLPRVTDVYASCYTSGDQINRIKTRTKDATADPEWNEELVLENYPCESTKGLRFHVHEEEKDRAPIVAADMPRSLFYPDGYEGELNSQAAS
jgi:hypothetical protein